MTADLGQTHYYGDGCADLHGVLADEEADALREAITTELARLLASRHPDHQRGRIDTLTALGQRLGMDL